MKGPLIIFASLIILIGLFVILRPSDNPDLPIGKSGDPRIGDMSGFTDIRGFSDAKKNKTPIYGPNNTRTAGSAKSDISGPTPSNLPYPRISINYSIQTTSSIGGNDAGANSTFIIATVDIRNYGYRYFDAYPNNFRGVTWDGEIRPLVNVSAGNVIDAVIPNNSRAKGRIVFLVKKGIYSLTIKYSPVNKSENYNVLYKYVSQSEMGDKKQETKDGEDV